MEEVKTVLTIISVVVSIIGLLSVGYMFVFKVAFDRIKALDNGKCNKDMCAARHEQIAQDLQKGDDRFAKIMDKLENIGITLALLAQRQDAADGGKLKGLSQKK